MDNNENWRAGTQMSNRNRAEPVSEPASPGRPQLHPGRFWALAIFVGLPLSALFLAAYILVAGAYGCYVSDASACPIGLLVGAFLMFYPIPYLVYAAIYYSVRRAALKAGPGAEGVSLAILDMVGIGLVATVYLMLVFFSEDTLSGLLAANLYFLPGALVLLLSIRYYRGYTTVRKPTKFRHILYQIELAAFCVIILGAIALAIIAATAMSKVWF